MKENSDKVKSYSDKTIKLTKQLNPYLSIEKIVHSTINPPEGKGGYYEEHTLKGTNYDQVDFKNIENLDYYNGKLFWPDQGKIFTAEVRRDEIALPKAVHDFTDYKFKAIRAPY